MILSQISWLDCIVFLLSLVPQLLLQVGLLRTAQWLLPALPLLFFEVVVIPYQFLRERYYTPVEERSPFVQRATVFQDIVIRYVRFAFANMPAWLGRVFFSKGVSQPFLRFRMMRHGIVSCPIQWKEINRPEFKGIWITHSQIEQPDIIIYYCHGGGFSMGSGYFYMEFLLAWLTLLKEAGYKNPALFSLEYTLVPDAVYPKQLQEALAGYEYVVSIARDSSRICVSGDSAGATILLSFLLYMTDHPTLRHQRPGLAIMISPWVTVVSKNNRNTASDFIDSNSLELYGRQYIGQKVPIDDPLVSPGNCKDVNKWINASPEKGWHFLFGSEETLGPETRKLISLLMSAGIEVDYNEQDGGIHAWPVAALYLGETKADRLHGLRDMANIIRARMS